MRTFSAVALVVLAFLTGATALFSGTPVAVVSTFVGNKDSKVFHLPSCKLVAKIKPGRMISFATREEAKAAGYTPCKICLK